MTSSFIIKRVSYFNSTSFNNSNLYITIASVKFINEQLNYVAMHNDQLRYRRVSIYYLICLINVFVIEAIEIFVYKSVLDILYTNGLSYILQTMDNNLDLYLQNKSFTASVYFLYKTIIYFYGISLPSMVGGRGGYE